MRLRYLHLQNYPPIADIKVRFASGSPLDRNCAIRFVVGLNGSGKSNLLRAIAEVFLALADMRVPPFPVTLFYELGARGSKNHRTLLLHSPGDRGRASFWVTSWSLTMISSKRSNLIRPRFRRTNFLAFTQLPFGLVSF